MFGNSQISLTLEGQGHHLQNERDCYRLNDKVKHGRYSVDTLLESAKIGERRIV